MFNKHGHKRVLFIFKERKGIQRNVYFFPMQQAVFQRIMLLTANVCVCY